MRASRAFVCLFLFFITSCAAPRKPLLVTAPEGAVTVNTLSTSVSLAVRSRAGNLSGNGLMVFRRPDRFHLVMLSPFGSTVMEAFASGEQLTLLYPSQGVGYDGRFDDLPDGSCMRGWRLLRWVMDATPSGSPPLDGTFKRVSPVVGQETVTYKSGLVIAKSTSEGDRVVYRNHELVNGVPLAMEVELETVDHDRIRLVLEDPEVNAGLEDSSFVPRLENLRLLPLSALPIAAPAGNGPTE